MFAPRRVKHGPYQLATHRMIDGTVDPAQSQIGPSGSMLRASAFHGSVLQRVDTMEAPSDLDSISR